MASVRKDRIQVDVEINGEKVGKTIADLQKQYRQANKELRNLTIGSEEFVAKQKEIAGLKGILDEQRKAVADYAKALDQVQPRSLAALTRQAAELRQQLRALDPATQDYINASRELKTVEAELAGITQEAENIQRELDGIEPDSLEALEAQAKSLRAELKKLSPASEEFRKKAEELKEVETRMSDIGEAAKDAGRVSILSAEGMKKAFKSLDTALRATIIGFLAGLATSLLASAKAALQATGEMQGLREELNRLTGATGDQLNRIAAGTAAVAEAYEVDLKGAIQATSAAANAFGEDYGETLKRITDGLLVAGSRGDEFLEQVREYSPLLRQAGLTAEQSFAVIADAINRGIFNDKAAEAIKTFNENIKNLSTGQREILEKNLGQEFTQRIVEGIEANKITSIQALGEISGELGKLGSDSAATQQVISDIFGGPGEDAGADFIISLQNVKGGLSDLIDETNIYVQRQREIEDLTKINKGALAELSFQLDGTGNFFKKAGLIARTFFLKSIVATIDFFRGLPTQVEIAGVKVLEGINFLSVKGSELLNNFIEPLRKLAEFTGIDIELPEIKLPTFEIDRTPEQIQREYFEKLAQERKDFAAKQEQEALKEQAGAAAARRLQALKLQREREAQAAEAARQEAEAFAKAKAEAQVKIEDLEAALIENETTRKIRQIELATKREIAALQGSEEQITQQRKLLSERAEKEIAALEAQAREQAETSAYEQRLEALERFNRERQLLITQQIIEEAEDGTLREDLEQELQDRLLEQYQAYLIDKQALEKEFGIDSLETLEELEKKKLEATKDRIAGQLQAEKDQAAAEAEIREDLLPKIEKTLSNLQTLNSAIETRQLDRLQKNKEAELALAGESAERRAAIEEKYQEEQARIEKEALKRRRLVALAQKAISIREVIIDTSKSISKTAGTLGFPAAIPFILAAAALGATQVATIAAQKFAKGGELPVTRTGGVTGGPSHREGGIALVDSRSGQVVGEVEGGEPILSRATYSNNRELIDRLLYSSKHLGGARIYEQGGLLGAPSTTPSAGVLERVEAVANFDNTQLVAVMQEVRDAVKQIRLRIGEQEAARIDEIANNYRRRIDGTGL